MISLKKLIARSLSAAILFSLTACGSGSATVPDSDNATSQLAFTAALAVGAEAATSFDDVPADADYAQAVAWCKEKGIMNGVSDASFDPDGTLTRAMLVTTLYRAEGEPAVTGKSVFTDASAGTWYSNAVVWANESGLVQGYGNGLFGVNDPVSVEQLEVILGRYTGTGPEWVGDPAKAQAATRAQVAVALYTNLASAGTSAVDAPVVYMTTDISPEGLMAIYEALEWTPTGKVAVKISTGESENSNHLRPEFIKDLVQKVDGTIVECNTAYGGSRSSTAAHKQAAADRGYTAIAEVDIMDEDGSMTLPVVGGDNLTENYVGAHFSNYDSFLVLSHFKGHAMAGFGGAIKNISIGIASSSGKSHIHSGGTGGSMWGGEQDAFLESMAEAGKSVADALDGKIVYINVMNRLSVDCDCDANPAEPDMHDIGILASYDPVALDQACVDLVYAAEDGGKLVQRIESRNGIHTLEQAEKIGLGSREYQIVSIDSKEESPMNGKVNVTFNGHTYTATLEENSAVDAFVALIQENGGSITISASDYGGWEKVGSLGQSLPRSDAQTTTSAGDFVLYSGNQIVLFYGSNSWSYTRLGKLDGDLSDLRADLGSGDVEITYSLVK